MLHNCLCNVVLKFALQFLLVVYIINIYIYYYIYTYVYFYFATTNKNAPKSEPTYYFKSTIEFFAPEMVNTSVVYPILYCDITELDCKTATGCSLVTGISVGACVTWIWSSGFAELSGAVAISPPSGEGGRSTFTLSSKGMTSNGISVVSITCGICILVVALVTG